MKKFAAYCIFTITVLFVFNSCSTILHTNKSIIEKETKNAAYKTSTPKKKTLT